VVAQGRVWGPGQCSQYKAGGVQTVNSRGFFRAPRAAPGQICLAMPSDSTGLSPEIQAALAACGAAPVQVVHRLQVGLARLVLEQAPASAASQLQLALAFIDGQATAAQLLDARQDCWLYVGALACGCSLADSASAHAIMTCLETDATAHASQALHDQVERVLRCGATEPHILSVLRTPQLL